MSPQDERLRDAVSRLEKAANAIMAANKRNGGFLKPDEHGLTEEHDAASAELREATKAARL